MSKTLVLPTVEQILEIAAREIGIVEKPENNVKYNTYYYGKEVNDKGLAWCQVFAWCVQAQFPDAIGLIFPSKTASTVNAADWYKKRKQWGTEPRVGAQPFYNISGLGRISHTGAAVEKIYSDGSFSVVEGNTNGAGSRTGGMVVRQKRKNMGVGGGFGYPAYATVKGVVLSDVVHAAAGPGGSILLVVDRDFGTSTKKRLQESLNRTINAGLVVDGNFATLSIKALQRRLNRPMTGTIDKLDVVALQKRVGAKPDGDWGGLTTERIQITLNAGEL